MTVYRVEQANECGWWVKEIEKKEEGDEEVVLRRLFNSWEGVKEFLKFELGKGVQYV